MNLQTYIDDLSRLTLRATFTGGATSIAADDFIGRVVDEFTTAGNAGGKIMLIGNGGSAAICSHTATDLVRNGGISALVANDPSLFTCLSNDYGFDQIFAQQVSSFLRPGDVLVAISSSGRSVNILNGVARAREKGVKVVTLSGFDAANPLRIAGELNGWVDSHDYGLVELSHQILMHLICDRIRLRAR